MVLLVDSVHFLAPVQVIVQIHNQVLALLHHVHTDRLNGDGGGDGWRWGWDDETPKPLCLVGTDMFWLVKLVMITITN